MAETSDAAAGRAAPVRWYMRPWVREALFVVGVYAVYTFVRNQFGSGSGDHVTRTAFDNAVHVLRIEDWLHILNEPQLQDATNTLRLLPWLAAYYSIAHFVVTAGVAVWLYHRRPHHYRRLRLAVAISTACAAVTFALFPLMPPRLINHDGPYGGAKMAAEEGLPDYGFDDSLETHKGPWNYEAGPVADVSNQFAAMPSLHAGWAFSCAFALSATRRRWLGVLGFTHALLTTWAVVATANHYWLDVVGGAALAVVGALVAWLLYGPEPRAPADEPDPTTAFDDSVVDTPEAVG